MRRNKGYTLVELVVAVTILLIVMAEVGALMINSQHLYRNGFYEVSIQEEAQQVIQQVEDLMINSTGGVTFDRIEHNGIFSDKITITSELAQLDTSGIPNGTYDTVVYTIGLAFDVHGSGAGDAAIYPNGDPVRSDSDYGTDTHPYESLILGRTINGGDATYSTLAEGVRALHVDVTKQDGAPTTDPGALTNYQADYVTISVEMQNAQYSYTSTSSAASVYLRNRPNTKPTPPTMAMDSGAVSNDVSIDVLRYHPYNLQDYVGTDYTHFKFESASQTFYSFKADGHTIICNKNTYANWGASIPATSPVTVICSKNEDFSDPVKIRLHTDPVSGGSYPLYAYDTWTATCTSVLPVKGICVHCATTHAMWPELYLKKYPGPNAEVVKFGSWDLKGEDGKSYEYIDMSTVEGTDAKPFINNYFMSNGALPTGVDRYETTGTVTIPLGQGGNFNYSTYEYKGTGDKKDGDGNIIIDNYNSTGSYEWKYSGEESTFKDNVVYTWGTVPADVIGTDSNAVLLKTTTDLSAGDKYWNCIVKQCEGYIRVRILLNWGEDGKYLQLFGYYYPQQNGDKTAHNMLLDTISSGTGDGTVGDEYTVVITTPTTTPKPTATATVDDVPDIPNGEGNYGPITFSGAFNAPGAVATGMVRITKVDANTVTIKAFTGTNPNQIGTFSITKNADNTFTMSADGSNKQFATGEMINGQWGGADQNAINNNGSVVMTEQMKQRLTSILGITFN